MRPAERTNYYTLRQEKNRTALDELESEYQKVCARMSITMSYLPNLMILHSMRVTRHKTDFCLVVHQRVKNIEEMDDNRKTRVADMLRQQQSKVATNTSRSRGASVSTTGSTGQTWSSVVKTGVPASSSSSTSSSSSIPTRQEIAQSPRRTGRSEYVPVMPRSSTILFNPIFLVILPTVALPFLYIVDLSLIDLILTFHLAPSSKFNNQLTYANPQTTII